ncbi:hypothetical protein CHS0354_030459 [Potamilus streckersoni]|uniref:Uncharacterized protein n=1 Tax=Potamilus streckersoni TaxID=2493646 RepID=A0AAE0T2K7_9BIVA|nr:hypothetical protein CHS0354_030459 [Potamilus streckersoni]
MWIKVLLLFCIIMAVYSQTMSDSTKLIEDLLSGYDKLVRPVADQSQPVSLYISMDLVAIQEFDEVLEKFSVVAVIYIIWEDIRMTWNSSEYNGLSTILIPQPNVWTPTLLVTNSFGTVKPIGADWMKVRYYDNGISVYSPGDVFQTTCAVDVTFYPYDAQTCKVMLIPWGSLPTEITIYASKDYVLKSYFSENGEWEVTSTSVTSGKTDVLSYIEFIIKMKRRPRFILVNVLLPIIFMGILNIMVFILPAESGERVSFCITVLLAFAVFLTIVGDNLPKTSKPMPMICYFLLVNLSLSTFISIMTILNLRLYHKPESKPVPRLLAVMARKLKCMCAQSRNAVQPFVQKSINEIPVTKKEKMSFELKKESDQMWTANENLIAAVSWKDISGIVDSVLCMFSILWLIISSTMFIVMIESNKEIM